MPFVPRILLNPENTLYFPQVHAFHYYANVIGSGNLAPLCTPIGGKN